MSEHELRMLLAEAKIAIQDLIALCPVEVAGAEGPETPAEVARADRLLRRIRRRV